MSDTLRSTPNLADTVNVSDRRTLMHIFQHPPTHNLGLREVTGLFKAIGSAEESHGGDCILSVGGDHVSIKRPRGKDLVPDDVMALRHLLQRTGYAPDADSPLDGAANHLA